MGGPNFDIISDLNLAWVRSDFVLADRSLANPQAATSIVDGEWLTFDSSNKLVRATTIGSAGNEPGNNSFLLFPVWAERGRTDVQSLGQVPIVYSGFYEADTLVFDATYAGGTGAAITAIGQPLKLATITLTTPTGTSRNYTGIVGSVYNESGVKWVGYVQKLSTNNNGRLRFYAKMK